MSHHPSKLLVAAPRGALWAAEAGLALGRWWRAVAGWRPGSTWPARHLARLNSLQRGAITRHLLALSAQDRGDRFMGGVDDDYVRRYTQRIDFTRDTVFAVQDGSHVVALAHAALSIEDAERVIDLGLSVDAAVRRSGHGRRLLRAVLDQAERDGVRRVVVRCRAGNRAMAALAHGFGARSQQRWGETVAVIDIPR